VVEKIVEGKMSRYYKEVCLYEQPFVKDETISVSQLISDGADKLGEKISVRRFARFKVGDGTTAVASHRDPDPDGEEITGVAVRKPDRPKTGSGSAAAKPETTSE
jgi:elongation factor Ts